MSQQLANLTARKATKHETRALQKAMGESEQLTEAYYQKRAGEKFQKAAAKPPVETPLFGTTDVKQPQQRPTTISHQTSLW